MWVRTQCTADLQRVTPFQQVNSQDGSLSDAAYNTLIFTDSKMNCTSSFCLPETRIIITPYTALGERELYAERHNGLVQQQ